MNRRQRRQTQRRDTSARRIRALEARVEATGKPGVIHGLTDACRDCGADGQMILLPGKQVFGRVFHDDGCPALTGAVKWEPVPL